MTPSEAIDALAQMAQCYINAQPPAVRMVIGSVAQQSINVLTEATKPPAEQPPKA